MPLKPTYEELLRKVKALEEEKSAWTRGSGIDTTNRVSAEIECAEKQSGRLKGTGSLGSIINVEKIQSIMDDFHKLTGMVTAILDMDGNVVEATGWQDICTKFHRIHPETAKRCTESDLYLGKKIMPGEYMEYRCKNGLWDVVTPLYIGNEHLGNIYTGQFFYDDDLVDENRFIQQAETYGFDKDAYLAAFRHIPIYNRKTVKHLMRFLVQFTSYVSNVSYANMKLEMEIHDRKQAEEALQGSEGRLRSLINALPDLVWLKDCDGVYLACNARFEKFLGAEEKDIIGKNDYHFMSKDSADFFRSYDKKALDKGGPNVNEEEIIFADDGHREILETIKTPIYTLDGRISGVLGIGRDITDRKKAEEELRESKLFLDNISDIAYRADDQGNLLWVNSAGESITGLPLQELIGKPFLPLFIPSDHASLMEFYNRTLLGESLENTLTFTSGVTCHFTILPYRNENGHIVGTFGVARDITERISTERALAISEDRLKKAQTAAKIGNWEYDVATGKVWGSEEAFRIYGIDRKSEYLPLDEVESHIIDAKSVNQALVDLLTKEKDYDIEFRVTQGNTRKTVTIHSVAELVKDNKGNPTKVIGVIQDITEKKVKEEENIRLVGLLQQAQKLESIGNLAGGIAHDFNNILFPIMGLSELLVEDFSPGSLEHENARQILKAAERGSDLVQQILAFSRQTDHKMMPMRIQNVLEEALKLARSTIPANIDIKQHIQMDCGLVNGDATQVHQIGMNLITNAFHALGDAEGEINVQLKEVRLENEDVADLLIEPGRYAMLTVTDTGCGMDPFIIKKIFEPYFTTKAQGKGTGLGLAVVYGIVKEHKGGIKVISEPNEGTTFTVYLPLIEESNEKASIEKSLNYETGNERILLVDDEKPILIVEKQMLARLGYHVTVRTSSLDALETFAADPDAYDMVISDMSMPNMAGDKLAQKLISIRPDIPIIICTGFSERIDKGKADSIGIKGFLLKPIARSALARMVREVLDEARRIAQE